MTQEVKTIVANSLPSLLYRLEDLILEGWKVDKNSPPDMLGFAYEVHLIKDAMSLRDAADRLINNAPPRLTREEITAKARAAKAAKAAERAQQEDSTS